MKTFKLGQKVSFIDEAIDAIITKIDDDWIQVETEEGFLMDARPNEIIILEDPELLDFDEPDIFEIIKEKETKKKHKTFKKTKEGDIPPMEVDLHIHQLVTYSKGMSNHDMLNLQLDTARRQLEFAIKKRIQKVVFIHGVGEGVLRMELEYLFSRYENVKFYDADYSKYGLGATEVYIFQNP